MEAPKLHKMSLIHEYDRSYVTTQREKFNQGEKGVPIFFIYLNDLLKVGIEVSYFYIDANYVI